MSTTIGVSSLSNYFIKDSNGNVLSGIKRSSGGGLVVDNSTELSRYRHDLQVHDDIAQLKREINDLKLLVQDLLNND